MPKEQVIQITEPDINQQQEYEENKRALNRYQQQYETISLEIETLRKKIEKSDQEKKSLQGEQDRMVIP